MRITNLLALAGAPLLGLAAPVDGPEDQPGRMRFRGPKDEAPIGEGDRFNRGQFFPLGAATGTPPEKEGKYMFETIMNHNEVLSAMIGLREEYGIRLISPPHKTAEDRRTVLGLIPCDQDYSMNPSRCGTEDSYNILLTAGLLGHDRSTNDALIYFISDLLFARKNGLGLEYGNATYSEDQVRRAASVGIVFYPMINIDGMIWDHEHNACWRRNRNNATMEDEAKWRDQSVGVDLNRNFDFAWDFERILDTSLRLAPVMNSDSPRSELFRGPKPMSEQETKNIAWVFSRFPRLGWLMDIRLNGRRVVHPWGIDLNQDQVAEQNWRNTEFGTYLISPTRSHGTDSRADGKRGDRNDEASYGEYMDPFDKAVHMNVSYLLRDEMWRVAGRNHSAGETAYLGPHTGTFIDWAYARHLVNRNDQKVISFAVEYGEPERDARRDAEICGYYPNKRSFNLHMQEAAAAMMRLLLEASQRRY